MKIDELFIRFTELLIIGIIITGTLSACDIRCSLQVQFDKDGQIIYKGFKCGKEI